MCMMIEKHIKPSIVKKDITVYKQIIGFSSKIGSPFQGFYWEIGVEECTKMRRSRKNSAFDNIEEKDYNKISSDNIKYIGKGFHSAGSEDRLNRTHTHYQIMECIIPKGAYYYHNLSDLYVSNRLIPVKLLKR
jgi:hypothetical protein